MQPVKFLKFLRQFVVLVERNLQLIWNDKLLLASLTLQSPFMVLVVKLTADPNCFTSNLVNIGSRTALFVLAAMATFMGTLNSYREICREREIILREASVGVSLPAVVLSKAAVLLLSHIGYQAQADKLTAALDKCMFTEKALTVTGRDTGCTCTEFGDYVMRTIETL